MHSSRMRTVRSSSRLSGGRSASVHTTPRSRPPWTRHPRSRHPPGSRHPPRSRPPGPVTSPRPGTPPVDRMTDTCKNITFATSLRTVNITFNVSGYCRSTSTYVARLIHPDCNLQVYPDINKYGEIIDQYGSWRYSF